jgi:hypothetical protein
VRGSYYDVLGVSPTADESEIRARYLLLMRRHHPDVNPSPMAHARASQIGEAFHALTDPALRSRHDAELAQQRQDAVSARAIVLYRGRKSRLPKGPGRLSGAPGARLALAALLVVTALAGWRMEKRLTASENALSAVTVDEDTEDEARQTIAALKVASTLEAQAMPPVSREAVAGGTGAFRRLVRSNPTQARAFSERCHADAANRGSWEALDFCVAFDQAAFLADGKKPSVANADYFVDRHDRAAHLYVPKISSMDAIAGRLDQIRDQVAPARNDPPRSPTARVLHGIAKRGWKLADAARNVFDPARAEHIDSAGRARDF